MRTPTSLRAFFALCLAACALAGPAGPSHAAGPYDPEINYRNIVTPHYIVVFAEGYEHIARRAAEIAETLVPSLRERYGHALSGRTTIIINDQFDFANGSASVSPNKVATIYVTAPIEVSGIEDYDDWLMMVILHEMTHIYDLDMAYGLPWLGQRILGKYVTMNSYAPTFITEGIAVYEETVGSGSGRGRSSYSEMVLRMAALADRFPSIDQGFRSFSFWPFGNVAYFVGGHFQLWLAEHYGEDALLRYHRANAANPVPYLTVVAAKIAFGHPLESLWNAFEAEVKSDAELVQAQVLSSTLGETRPTRMTNYGGDLLGPRISPDGRSIVFSTSSPADGIRIRRMPLGGGPDEVLLNDTFSKAFSFTSDGKAFYFQQTEINQRFYAQNSLLRYDLERDAIERLAVLPEDEAQFVAPSGSLRARDPDISPGGKQIVFVQTPYGANQLVLAWIESDGLTLHPKVIVPPTPDVMFSNPRFSPRGDQIAVSRFRRGRRDVLIIDLSGRVVTEVTRDRALDIDPSFSPDGRWLVFASDRTGIYNLYAYDLLNERLHQLTNLVSGAYQPCVSPDGQTLVFRGYSADGFDVYRLPFAPARSPVVPRVLWPEVQVDRRTRRGPIMAGRRVQPIPPPAAARGTPLAPLPNDWSIGSYNPLPTLLPFHDNWVLYPNAVISSSGIAMSLGTYGQDALATHTYSVSANYGTETNYLGGSASYVNDTLEPTFQLGASTDAVIYNVRARNSDGFANYIERRARVGFGFSLPLLQRHLIFASYSFEDRAPLEPERLDDLLAIPSPGRFARVSLGYSYSNYRLFAHSISPERGFRFGASLSALSKGLGSSYEQIVAYAGIEGYLSIPFRPRWLKNHVLAGQFRTAFSAGPDLAETFRLGGSIGESAFSTSGANYYPLRGVFRSGLTGTAVLQGTLEYRAPILRIERGPGTFPVVLRVLHAAVFSDFGRTFQDQALEQVFRDDFFRPFAITAGAELRADLLLGYIQGLTVRLGYARALAYPEQARLGEGFYGALGSTF